MEYVFTQNQNLLTTNSIKIELSKLHVYLLMHQMAME